jgi:hypothetical protein
MDLDDVRESFGLAVCVVWLISVSAMIGFGYVAFSVALETGPERALSHNVGSHHRAMRVIKDVHAQHGGAAKAVQGGRKESSKKAPKALENRKAKAHAAPLKHPIKGSRGEG